MVALVAALPRWPLLVKSTNGQQAPAEG